MRKKSLNKLLTEGTFMMSAISFLLAVLASGIIMAVCGYNPFSAFGAILDGAFGSTRAIAQTLLQATPLIFTGLAFVFAKKATLINLGIEGQLLTGGLAAAFVGVQDMGLPAPLHIALALIAGMIVGGAYAAIVGVMKVKFGSNEVIATIMLNNIAVYVTGYVVAYPLRAEGSSVNQTEKVADSAVLPRLIGNYRLTIAIFIAVLACILVKFFMDRTTLGFEIKSVGKNLKASETAGIKIGKIMIISMAVSGAIAGLAGGAHVLGVDGRYIDGFSPGYGFSGIAVAALASDHPIGVILSGILFGALKAGCMVLSRETNIPTEFIDVIQAFVIIFVAAPLLVKDILIFRNKKKEVQADA